MKNKLSVGFLICVLIALGWMVFSGNYKSFFVHKHIEAGQDVYTCPMHPGIIQNHPGSCPICQMSLVKKERPVSEEKVKDSEEICVLHNCPMKNCAMMVSGKAKDCSFCGAHLKSKDKKILFYRNPMDPKVTSQIPMKDSMGMDYIPVYEEGKMDKATSISIDPQRQQLIGIKKETVQIRPLTRKIRTIGRVARENIFTAQGKAIWAYLTLYETEINLIKTDQKVELEAIAYPGQFFYGKVYLSPSYYALTQANPVKVKVQDPGFQLRPDMLVNATIFVDLGKVLSVSKEAVIHSGKRSIVVVTDDQGHFYSRQVHVGQSGEGYYEVKGGLKEGDVVVTSGNFLIDSEARLQSAINDETDK